MKRWWTKSILIHLSVTQNNTMINNYHLNTVCNISLQVILMTYYQRTQLKNLHMFFSSM